MNINITDFITSLLPKSAQTRELAVKKLAGQQVVSGIYFLLEAARAGDVTALMALSGLMLKESKNCHHTQKVVKDSVEKVLQLDKDNSLASNILKSITKADSKGCEPSHSAAKKPTILEPQVQVPQNVVSLETKLIEPGKSKFKL